MEGMNDWVGLFIQSEVRKLLSSDATILDVGAGWGKYCYLLPEYTMDAVEIWEPYIEADNLNYWYRNVYHNDICGFGFEWYDAIILGDVFEHIQTDKAKNLLDYLIPRCQKLFIAVPYEYKQGEVDGNPYETHLQDSLTDGKMRRLYPRLKLVKQQDGRGVYVSKR